MVAKIILIVCFVSLAFFLIRELLDARRWKYLKRINFSDEEAETVMIRDREILKTNKLFEWLWLSPFKDLRKARKAGFIRIPMHITSGFIYDLWTHTSAYYTGRILGVDACDVSWKDKFGTPRYEFPPHIYITLFGTYGINIVWSFGKKEGYNDDKYWEEVLWTTEYCGGDLNEARKTWPWVDMEDKSTWDEKYVKNKK